MTAKRRRLQLLAIMLPAAALLATACAPAHQARDTASTTAPSSSASPPPATTGACGPGTTCYTPQQLQAAYGVTPLLDRGFDGKGQTIVLPELAETHLSPPVVTDMRQDMTAYDHQFHLPAAQMKVVTTLAGASSPWLAFAEEVLDVEVVHALAPDARLVILLLPNTSMDNTRNEVAATTAALRLGPALGGVMSISAAGQVAGQHCVSRAQASHLNTDLHTAVNHGMTVVASSGDIGAAAYQCDLYAALTGTPPATPAKGILMLASNPYVLSAGGTALSASSTGTWTSETAWDLASGNSGNAGGSFQASGGGFSDLFARPSYQVGVPGTRAAERGAPDVSADASDRPGIAVVFRNGSQVTVESHGGTSAAAPIWAALIALADQYAGHHLGFVNPAIYQIARSRNYHQAFHDVTTGNNTAQFARTTITGYQAAPGWDPVTGWGSPNAQVLIPLLARTR
ncbi:MAG TPA: S53 family peptidase [Streptosporangiaceae bacterium]